jgi:serine/threonine protein phosphatase PrpC
LTQTDHPNSADVLRHSIQDGDLIIMASDGVRDNLLTSEIVEFVCSHLKRGEIDPEELAKDVASAAEKWSLFGKRNCDKHLKPKPDDITVVVGVVKSDFN